MRALIFPGQGSQAVGMAKGLAEAFPQARSVLDEVDSALGRNLSRLMFEGPAEELTLTTNAQPALMAASLAALRVLEAERGLDLTRDVACVAGHSLGEYAALAAAGSLSVADAARLLRLRGAAMQEAVAPGAGAMAALIGTDLDTARSVAEAAVQESGGAVCVELTAPRVALYANVLAAPVADPEAIRSALVAQVTGTVRWRESVAAMAAAGVDRFYELGAGKVLTGLVKRIAPEASATAIGTPADVAAFAL